MGKARKLGMQFSAVIMLTAAYLAIALAVPCGTLAADRDGDRDDDGGGRHSRSGDEAGIDRSGFPQPEVRRSSHGLLRTRLRAFIVPLKSLISTNNSGAVTSATRVRAAFNRHIRGM